MDKPVPYEHRGARYRQLDISNASDALEAVHLFRSEDDVWLKKLIASKLIAGCRDGSCGISEAELNEVLKCRIK